MTERDNRHLRTSLRVKILVPLAALVLVSAAWGAVNLWSAWRTEVIISRMAGRDLPALMVAQELETELVMQKGFATYFFLSDDPGWLEQLETHKKAFESSLAEARDQVYQDEQRVILNRVESEYLRYDHLRDQVLEMYRQGSHQEGSALHWQAREQFEALLALCDEYKRLHEERIARDAVSFTSQARVVSGMTWGVVPLSFVLVMLLGWLLILRVLNPIRRLLAHGEACPGGPMGDEITALSERMHTLEADVDLTQAQLVQSREHLLQSEKLALVGKLAAGVAHSIRNPFTSVKMRLFSLERGLKLDATQKEDFEVIAEEIRHLDTIIRNFLEFARRPKLMAVRTGLSRVVDNTLELLRHRLESSGVAVRVERQENLPEVDVDVDQLKEALVNLLLNACEAMGQGGEIEIREELAVVEPLGRAVVIRLTDTGPGIPAEVREEMFQPFFSTKEEGSGLGLPIAKRIMEEHGGILAYEDLEGCGASFVLAFPLKEGD